MERRWLMLFAGILIGAALGLAVLEGIPEEPTSRFTLQQVVRDDGSVHDLEETLPSSGGQGLDSSSTIAVGADALDFSLYDVGGKAIQLSDFRGRVVLLNFWATWCAPCRSEMPVFQNRYERLSKDGFVVLAVNFAEPEEDVREFMQEFTLTFPILLDPKATVHELYRIKGYPTSVFINEDGQIEIIHLGRIQERQLDTYLQSLGLDV